MEIKLLSMVFLPWCVFIVLGAVAIFCASKLITWAKARRGGVIVLGALIQMLLPDPYVQQTLETIVIEEKIQKKRAENKQSEL